MSEGFSQPCRADARDIATSIARSTAASVDAESRFPHESLAALRAARLLSAGAPKALGGRACPFAELAEVCCELAAACPSTGLIFAMHQVQVLCLMRHARPNSVLEPLLDRFLSANELIAGATSEVGTGGDIRKSIAAIVPSGDTFALEKRCATISYGGHADGIFVTARRHPSAGESDQIVAFVERSQYTLEEVAPWDAMGMRGTCSHSYVLRARLPQRQVLDAPFQRVAQDTMTPASHILWSACWLGIATNAVSIARAAHRASCRGGQSPSQTSFALLSAMSDLLAMSAIVRRAAAQFERRLCGTDVSNPRGLSSIVADNNLKIACSQLVVSICGKCIEAVGFRAYLNDGPYSLARHLRDAWSAPLMISNDRLARTTTDLLALIREEDNVEITQTTDPSRVEN